MRFVAIERNSRALNQLIQAQAQDLFLLLGGRCDLGIAVIFKTRLERGEDLIGALSGGTDDEDKPVALLVGDIGLAQASERFFGGARRARLLLSRPFLRGLRRMRRVANLGMRRKSFEIVLGLERRKRGLTGFLQGVERGIGALRFHLLSPGFGATAAQKRLRGGRRRNRIQPRQLMFLPTFFGYVPAQAHPADSAV